MKVKATKDYFDKVLKQDIAADTELGAEYAARKLELDEARATVLVSAGVAVVIPEETEEQPKKPSKKKEPKNEQ